MENDTKLKMESKQGHLRPSLGHPQPKPGQTLFRISIICNDQIEFVIFLQIFIIWLQTISRFILSTTSLTKKLSVFWSAFCILPVSNLKGKMTTLQWPINHCILFTDSLISNTFTELNIERDVIGHIGDSLATLDFIVSATGCNSPLCTDFITIYYYFYVNLRFDVSKTSRFIIYNILIIETESCKKQSVSKIRTIKESFSISGVQ